VVIGRSNEVGGLTKFSQQKMTEHLFGIQKGGGRINRAGGPGDQTWRLPPPHCTFLKYPIYDLLSDNDKIVFLFNYVLYMQKLRLFYIWGTANKRYL